MKSLFYQTHILFSLFPNDFLRFLTGRNKQIRLSIKYKLVYHKVISVSFTKLPHVLINKFNYVHLNSIFKGGLKAVIYTDVIMFVVMFSTTLMVLIMGSIKAGGFARVWQFNRDMGRLDLG